MLRGRPHHTERILLAVSQLWYLDRRLHPPAFSRQLGIDKITELVHSTEMGRPKVFRKRCHRSVLVSSAISMYSFASPRFSMNFAKAAKPDETSRGTQLGLAATGLTGDFC
jgi:hypothetical protein